LCERGLERFCAKAQWHGFHRDGAMATHGNFAADELLEVAQDLSAHQVASLVGSGWSALGALRVAGVGAGQKVAIFGCGGVGHLAIQFAEGLGAAVHVIEPDADRRHLGESLGATPGLPEGGVDVALVCTPSTQAIAAAARGLARGGTMVLVGASPTGRFEVSLADTVFQGLTIRGNVLGSRSDLLEVIELHRRGAVRATVDSAPLDRAIDRLWWLRDGGFVGRLVFDCT
jgi:propanol-preferring alcohol dehydrogenase